MDKVELQARIDAHPLWYHTLDVAPGVTTPGWFDLRHALPLLPFPDVRGKRCLDIGTFDGFFAFEMERRGAAEVVAIDIEDHDRWDWPDEAKINGRLRPERQDAFAGPPKGDGFRLIHSLTGSNVEWKPLSIYELNPDELGKFDVVVCGSLLLHLRDPIGALNAVRSVTAGQFLSSEQLELWLSIIGRGRPLAKLSGSPEWCQWWLANSAAHRRMVHAAGFRVERSSPFFMVRFNTHPKPERTLRWLPNELALRALTRDPNPGVLHRALLATPRI
jgi:tRNA (mo5U34)-methyltransferase